MNPPEPRTASAQTILARYGELWLKGKNRVMFERALERNVRHALEPFECTVRRDYGQLVVTPKERFGEVARRLQDVFGLSTLFPARRAEPEPDEIVEVAHDVLGEAMEAQPRKRVIAFRVETTRSDKRFPMISSELDRYVADRVLPEYEDRVRVDLKAPELTLGINVRSDGAYVFAERLEGAGGLPVGTLGRTMCLFSGGIDSPVAAWLAMKRGCDVSFVAFHSYPFVGEPFMQKVRRLVRHLGRFQNRSRLSRVPFAEIQTAIRDACRPPYRTVLYRRMMQRIASRLASGERAKALVTGESLGQVASQTLENMACIGEASSLPVIRPLVTYDKHETIELARRIGTYGFSIESEPDCCTVFQPRRPVIHGTLADCQREEERLDVEALVEAAIAATETEEV